MGWVLGRRVWSETVTLLQERTYSLQGDDLAFD